MLTTNEEENGPLKFREVDVNQGSSPVGSKGEALKDPSSPNGSEYLSLHGTESDEQEFEEEVSESPEDYKEGNVIIQS
jgi:hypothetical protein